MLWIESRRYRFYDAFRARVRMLEAHFLVPMVMENRHLLQGEWKKLVCEDLILPSFKIGKLEAVARRSHPLLVRRDHLCRHARHGDWDRGLRGQEDFRGNLRVRQPSFALADL